MSSAKPKRCMYRSFKNFDLNSYLEDLQKIKPHEYKPVIDVNELYDTFINEVGQVIDKHAPVKTRLYRKQPVPYMNAELRKAIYNKQMLRNNFEKSRTDYNWEMFRKQRNLVTKLKRKSIQMYFLERCAGGQKSKDFWPTIKPFLSKKHISGQQKIILKCDNVIVNDTKKVCETFNNFFVNVAEGIGKGVVFDRETHPSIIAIKENKPETPTFEFQLTDIETVSKIISKIDVKKATGVDNVSAKLLKAGTPVLTHHILNLINCSILNSVFPDSLKLAQVAPLFKKLDPLEVTNYRPVSILPIISKVFEKTLSNQLSEYFDKIFHNFLCAFRKGHGCQTTLLRLLEDWKAALDKSYYVAAILMDLSKAFDCLPHDILLCKLSAYGLSESSVNLLKNYLSNRKQQIKIEGVVSEWANISKGVPQGSILGPLLFNVFINDIFYFIKKGTLYNYADDNTLSFAHPDYDVLISTLEEESLVLIDWFKINCMKANPDKFQALAVGNNTLKNNPVFNIDSAIISCDDVVNLLGISIDYQLNFDSHIRSLCRKASQQLNVLKRIGSFLSRLNKLTIFHTFILSNFNFCPLAWHFCSKTNTKKLEKIQERALRFIYNDYDSSYEQLLSIACVPSLHVRRMRTMAAETFKILYKLAPLCLHDLVHFKNSNYSFRYSNIVDLPRVRTTKFGKKSFRYSAAELWNDLPEYIRSVGNFNQFTNLLQSWNGKICKCTACSN